MCSGSVSGAGEPEIPCGPPATVPGHVTYHAIVPPACCRDVARPETSSPSAAVAILQRPAGARARRGGAGEVGYSPLPPSVVVSQQQVIC